MYERDGAWYLTSPEAVRFAHQHPEVFSSAKAFDSLGSPVPLIPLAIDPPAQIRYRRVLDPMFALASSARSKPTSVSRCVS